MPRIEYKFKRFHGKSQAIIALANEIIADFSAQGFGLTLRQLYYQMVAKNVFPNNEQSYNNLGVLISDARLAGLIDWDAIEDRTRNVRSLSHWEEPGEVIESAAHSFHLDLWKDQPRRVEIWIEKDALVGVIERTANKWDLPFFSCRGYTSQSEMWGAAQRIVGHYNQPGISQETTIIHLGDHDPSGIDMSRDIDDRLNMFVEHDGAPAPEIQRIALNMNQVRQYNPPPNPAKLRDCRAAGYIEKFGSDSWELDALSPKVINGLLEKAVLGIIDMDKFEAQKAEQHAHKLGLQKIADRYDDVVKFLNKPPKQKRKK